MHLLSRNNLAYKDLFFELIRTDFKTRYANSFLGFAWVLLKPFLLFTVIFVVFSLFFQSGDPQYKLNLLLGILLFSFFQEGTMKGMTSISERSQIFQKIKFPYIIAILASVANSFINFIFGLLIFSLFFLGGSLFATAGDILYFVVLVVFLVCIVVSFSLVASILFVRLRDLNSIWEIGLQILFYATPVIYPLSFIPERFQQLFLLNPLSIIITQSRSALITKTAWDLSSFLYLVLFSVVALGVSYAAFSKLNSRTAEHF